MGIHNKNKRKKTERKGFLPVRCIHFRKLLLYSNYPKSFQMLFKDSQKPTARALVISFPSDLEKSVDLPRCAVSLKATKSERILKMY